jgi:hypothetical protein
MDEMVFCCFVCFQLGSSSMMTGPGASWMRCRIFLSFLPFRDPCARWLVVSLMHRETFKGFASRMTVIHWHLKPPGIVLRCWPNIHACDNTPAYPPPTLARAHKPPPAPAYRLLRRCWPIRRLWASLRIWTQAKISDRSKFNSVVTFCSKTFVL